MVEEGDIARRRAGPWLPLSGAVAVGIPAVVLSGTVILTGEPHLSPLAESFIFGAGIVGAAFLLAWGSEVAQLDISQALAYLTPHQFVSQWQDQGKGAKCH